MMLAKWFSTVDLVGYEAEFPLESTGKDIQH
jgi:hypothetical protein